MRVAVVAQGDTAEVSLIPEGDGRAVFRGTHAMWHMRVQDHPGAARFADWLTSEVGQRAITGFKLDDVALFSLPSQEVSEDAEVAFDGNAVLGRDLSMRHCGRCHVVSEDNRMNGIGSTPSFFVLRTLADWDARFQSFYVLKPHGSFTQVTDVTEPFPANRPPAIIPVEITLDDLEAILAYVSVIQPADLGAPLEHQ